MDMDMEKTKVTSLRSDMISNLNSLISAATDLKDSLETAKKNSDFSNNAQTFGVAYGLISMGAMALVRDEGTYNSLISQISKAESLEGRKDKNTGGKYEVF